MRNYETWEHEDLVKRCYILEERLRQANNRSLADSWRLNPDRSGGQFTQQEIDEARRGGHGW